MRQRSQHRYRLCSAVLLASALCRPAWALDPAKPLARCSLETWRARDGLPGPWVRALAQTPDGHLWVATYGGLARYDGARFSAFGSTRAFPTASDIAGLAVAPDGRLWIMPSNGDPLCVRGEELEKCLPSGARLPPGARLGALLPEADGGVWMATRDELYHFTGGRLVKVGWTFGRVSAIVRDRLGLWL